MSDREAALLLPAGKNAHMKCYNFVIMICCEDPFWSHVICGHFKMFLGLTAFRSLRLAPSNFCINPLEKEVKVPWILQGAMLFSLVGAHAQAALLHSNKDLLWRVETAMCGCLLGIWSGDECIW